MLVRRKRSNKRKRRFYEAIEFTYSIEDVKEFLGDLGKVEVREKDDILYGMWIKTRDGRKICTGQYLLKDDRRKRIISFDQTIFYDFYDIWST
jgi:hypothetical protein